MYNIISNLLGSDFVIKDGYIYTTRLIKILNESSPVKITFTSSTIFPIRIYLRRLKSNESEVDLSIPMDIYNINTINDEINTTLEKNIIILIIFEYKRRNISDEIGFEIHFKESKYSTLPLMYMYETKTGLPYQVYKLGGYSEYEFNSKTGLYTISNSYLGKSMASKPLVGHVHDNERGFIDRVYTLSKYNKLHGKKLYKDKFLDERQTKETEFIYLNNGEYHQTVIDQSNSAIRGILFQTEDKFINDRLSRPKANMSISGIVWLDEFSLDGIMELKELKLKDIKVTLFNEQNKIVNTVITNEKGEYLINIYEEGIYYLKFDYSLIKEIYEIGGFTLSDIDKKYNNSSNVDDSGRSKDLYLSDKQKIIINAGNLIATSI